MRRVAMMLLLLSLAGCFTSGKRGAEKGLAIYDLGALPPALIMARQSPLAVEVRAPLWMDSLGVTYRLAYSDASRLREYAQVRWAGPPAQMVQQRLIHQLALSASGQGRARCVLRIEISEISQVFLAPESSKGMLQGKAYWLDPSRRQLAELSLKIEIPADSQNSIGGIAALQASVGQLALDLQAWERQLLASGKITVCSA